MYVTFQTSITNMKIVNGIIKLICSALFLMSVSLNAASSESDFIIGFPEDNLSNDWRAAQMNQIIRETRKHKNVRFLKADANGSVAKNILDIEDMVNQGVQLLFLAPQNPDALKPIVAKLRKKGIYIVLLTRKLNTEDYDVFIAPDDFKIAYDAASLLANKINGKGRILMLEGVPTTTTAINRRKGFVAAINNYPDIKIISRVANYSRIESISVMERLISKNEKIDAIYAHNDAMAAGARFTLKQAGVNPASIPTVGIDFLPETRDAIIKGEQLASFTYPLCGKIGVTTALKLLQGIHVPRYISVPSTVVTHKNVTSTPTVY